MFSTKPIKKWLKILVYGSWGSGKTTFLTTMPGVRFWVDSEHSGDKIRDDGDPVLHTTSFNDLQKAVEEIRNNSKPVGSLLIDPYTIFWERLIDHVESQAKDGLQFYHWARIKKPNKRLFTELLNLPCHVGLSAHEADVFEMQKNDKGKMEPIKVGVKLDAEKKTGYAPDVVMRMFIKDGKHYGEIEKIRIRKDLAISTGLKVGAVIESPTFDNFEAIIQAYAKGETPAHYTDDRETTEKDDKVFEGIDREQEEAECKKIIGQIQRGEKKCRELNIYGWQDDEQRDSTRTTTLGTADLSNLPVEELTAYRAALKNQVNLYQQKMQEA